MMFSFNTFNSEIRLTAHFVLTDHCMVNFIKKNLLGSLGEFRNRFINPIQNGQCADSTPKDVRVMKNRAHVLHAMLARCVQVRKPKKKYQSASCRLFVHVDLVLYSSSYNPVLSLSKRRDYSELNKCLPPKHEYVLAVRISPLQYKLYRYYLDHITGKNLSYILL